MPRMLHRAAGPSRATILIAPCGINCAVCMAFLRTANPCPGCRAGNACKCKTRLTCRMKTCTSRRGAFCGRCPDFPCAWVRHLDRRYRTRYAVSPIANLRRIAAVGVRRFAVEEKVKWTCTGCGATICMHRPACLVCGKPRAAH